MNKKSSRLDPASISELLRYDPETGHLFWRHRDAKWFEGKKWPAASLAQSWNAKFAGKRAFTASDDRGYHRGNILNRTYEAGRVIWAIVHGRWPEHQIDHENGDPTDNKIGNLRDATRTMQARNTSMPSTNKSGVVGVCWDKERKKWAAFVHLNDRIKHLGRFSDKASAIAARKNAEHIHGFHPNHGRLAA